MFGDYRFEHPLRIGDRLCFLDVGSYSLVRATMFNGIALPGICLAGSDGSLDVIGTTTYETWAASFGGRAGAGARSSEDRTPRPMLSREA
jgi:carboxynorspermidine decarboxylase